MTTPSKRTIATTSVAAFVTLTLAACAATNPRNDMLEHARAAVSSAQSNPQVSGEAEVDLGKAQQALRSGDALQKAGRPVEEVNHEAYIAERFARAAQKGADLLTSEKAIADANGRRNTVLLAARDQETANANDRAQRANDRAQTQTAEADAARSDLAAGRQETANANDLAQRANDRAQTQAAEADAARSGLAAGRQETANANDLAQRANDRAQTQAAEADAARSDLAAGRQETANANDLAQRANDRAQTQAAEADAARSDARASDRLAALSAQQNDASQQHSRQLESALADLQAKKTDRGLVITLGDVLFATGQAELRPGGRHSLDKLSNFMRQYPQRTVQIEGFTDNVGSEEYNQRLSEHRADAVRDVLTNAGVASDRIQTRGLGKSSPVADNDSATGRQQNRRVEVIISEGDDRTATRLQ
jgi:outer membrane protein OmpA-like peptidoglycan-associated protein